MMDLQTILEAIDQLPREEFQQVKQHVDELAQQVPQTPIHDVEARIAALNQAMENFWEGYSDAEVEAVIDDMNSEFIEPEDPELFGWIDDLPEDER